MAILFPIQTLDNQVNCIIPLIFGFHLLFSIRSLLCCFDLLTFVLQWSLVTLVLGVALQAKYKTYYSKVNN